MSCCNSCTQSSQTSQSNHSLSDFFPAGYRVTSGYPRYPYYVSVPVFVEEESCDDSCNGCTCNSCTCHCHCHCSCDDGCNQSCCNQNCGSCNGCQGYNRIRCTTRFCR